LILDATFIPEKDVLLGRRALSNGSFNKWPEIMNFLEKSLSFVEMCSNKKEKTLAGLSNFVKTLSSRKKTKDVKYLLDDFNEILGGLHHPYETIFILLEQIANTLKATEKGEGVSVIVDYLLCPKFTQYGCNGANGMFSCLNFSPIHDLLK
jgi:hypothetical protein